MNFHDGLNLILLLLGLLVFYRIIKGAQRLEFWHLISVTSADGQIWTDNDKVGQMTGLIFGTWIVCWLTLTVKVVDGYYVAALAIWLIYCAGMTAFAKWARAFVTDRFGKSPPKPEPETPQVTTTTTTKVTP